MHKNIMEKGLKSCTGVLLRAVSAIPPVLAERAWMAVPCLVSPQKDAPAGYQLFFHNFLLHYQHHISKNWRPILPSSYIWIFAWCAICSRFHRNNTTAEVNTTNDQNITL